MKNLMRALRMAFKYKVSLIGSMVCCVLVAALWGANISALYPFVEVVFKGESLHEWVDDRVASAEEIIEKNEKTIADLELEKEGASPSEARSIDARISRLASANDGESRKRDTALWAAPYIKEYLPSDAFQTLLWLVVLFVIATFIRGLCLMGNMVLVSRVGQKVMLDLQYMFFRKSLKMEMSEIDVNGTGDLVSRIRGETGAVAGAIMVIFGRTMREPMKMAVCIIGCGVVNWRLLLFSLIICPVAAWGMLKIARSTKRANKKAIERSAVLLNRLFQAVTYMRIVKAFNMEEHEQDRFESTAHDVYRKSMKIAFYNALARVNNEMLGVAIMCLSFLAAGYMVLTGSTHIFFLQLSDATMTFGEVMLFFAFMIGITDPLRKMADVYNLIQGGAVAADRVFPLMDAEPNVKSPENPEPFPTQAPEIRFEKVGFAYREGMPVLNETSFIVPAGKTVAIVGANGCGKSTLINMLPRFFDPQEGGIHFDDHEIRRYSLHDLRHNIGYVTQTAMLFNDSIIENIRYGRPDATLDQVREAARQAMADGFIEQLPSGYDTPIGEHGSGLSGGQRQRLTLARAILKDPKVLILDEATSQIDPKSEAAIHEALAKFIQDRTTIMITHRTSSLSLADQIVVMDEGKVIDQGTHEQLLARCPAYQKLRQSNLQEAA